MIEFEKKELRKKIINDRESLSQIERSNSEEAIMKMVLRHEWFCASDIFLCFAAYGSEIATEKILETAIKLQKKVYVPKVLDAKKSIMEFYRIYQVEDLLHGYKNIPEPKETKEKYRYIADECNKVLMLVPGVAFDKKNNRIGYGKGFYDRFLEDKISLQKRTIGIGFACQMVEKLPVSENDIKLCQVICV